MNQQLYVILYSKYSQNSNNLIKFIQNAPVDLSKSIGLNAICIDNEKIRDRILNCKQVKIQSVPTILVVYPTGGVEKYEGIKAFNWVEHTVKSLIPPSPPPPPLPIKKVIIEENVGENIDENVQENVSRDVRREVRREVRRDVRRDVQGNSKQVIKPLKPLPKRPKDPVNEKENIIDLDTLDNEEDTKISPIKKDNSLMAQAMAMQKERESAK